MKTWVRRAFLCSVSVLVLGVCRAHADTLPADIDLTNAPASLGTPATYFPAPATLEASASTATVAVGDFNRDGYDDLVVAYPNTDTTGTNNGWVTVYFGAANLPATSTTENTPVCSIYCNDNGATLGSSVATGDLDGDGRDELLLGAAGYSNGRGAVVIINGLSLAPDTIQGISFAAANPNGNEMRILGTEDTAQFGYSLAVGNFDGDDKWDVAAGEPYADAGAKTDAGKCYVWYGKDYVAGSTVSNTAIPNRWEIVGGMENNVGTSLAAGEGDTDGLDNLAIGALGYNSSSRVYYMGTLAPGTTTYDLDDPLKLNHGVIVGVPGLGFSLAMADTTGEGRLGLLMGAPLYGHNGMTNSGAAIEFLDLQSVIGNEITVDPSAPPAETMVYFGAIDGGLFGGSVAYSDMDGDTIPDTIIGEPGGPGKQAADQSGRVHIRYSPTPYTTGILDLADDPLDVTITGESAQGYFGASLAGGADINGDGIADLFAFAPFAVQGAPGLGNAYAIYGGRGDATFFRNIGIILAGGETTTYGAGGRLSPTSRLKVKFADGDKGQMTTYLCSGDCTALNLGEEDGSNVADVVWQASTNRANYTSATITVNYTDAEIAGLDEDYIALYTSPNGDAPWARAANQAHYADRNEFTAEFGTGANAYFAILLEGPSITIVGEDEIDWDCGTPYVDPGSSAMSPVDGDVTGIMVIDAASVDEHTLGDYFVTFNVTDSTGAPAPQRVRKVTVRDIGFPEIQLQGAQVVIECGGTYQEPGFTANDYCVGDVTNLVQVSGLDLLDTAIPGNYALFYDVTDPNGNPASESFRNVQVVDSTAPVITLVGDSTMQWECGVPWADPGATAFDSCDGDLTGQILISGGPADVSVEHSFFLSYDVHDSSNNFATELYRAVTVQDTTPPVITLLGDAEVTVECQQPYVDAGATMSDSCKGDVTDRLFDDANLVNTNVQGDYLVTFTGNDGVLTGANDAVPVTRTVHVVCSPATTQTADQDGNNVISLAELLRPLQIYNSFGYYCAENPGDTEDGYVPGPGANHSCAPYDTDYSPQDWVISLSELLRIIQFYNSLGYHYCPLDGTEDGFCPGI